MLCVVLRWSAIATHLPKRTDNEIKNYWNTHLKKRLTKMGIDPVTHKPKNDALLSSDGQSKTAANLSHMAQWESARLEAEARLVRESKLRSHSLQNHHLGSSHHHVFASSSSASTNSAPIPNNTNKLEAPPLPPSQPQLTSSTSLPSSSSSRSLEAIKSWNNGGWLLKANNNEGNGGTNINDLESPTSTLSFSENNNVQPIMTVGSATENNSTAVAMIEFVGTNSGSSETGGGVVKEEGEQWKGYHESSMTFTSGFHEFMEGVVGDDVVEEGFTNLLLKTNSDDSEGGGESNNGGGGSGSDFYEADNNNYWSSILNLVNSSPSDSPMF